MQAASCLALLEGSTLPIPTPYLHLVETPAEVVPESSLIVVIGFQVPKRGNPAVFMTGLDGRCSFFPKLQLASYDTSTQATRFLYHMDNPVVSVFHGGVRVSSMIIERRGDEIKLVMNGIRDNVVVRSNRWLRSGEEVELKLGWTPVVSAEVLEAKVNQFCCFYFSLLNSALVAHPGPLMVS